MLKAMLIVGAGGFVGSCLRYLVTVAANTLWSVSFPVGTFLVNIVGCFVIGLCYGMAEKYGVLSGYALLFLTTGLCGGFTTFSAFANEAWLLGSRGEMLTGLFYVVASIAVGYLCVWLGRCVTA